MGSSPRELLDEHGLSPKKSWGQNFLSDAHALEAIVEAASLRSGDTVIELGAGLGHLTERLAASGARVIAVERDRDMVRVLQSRALSGVEVVAANAAELDFSKLTGGARAAVVGNLPYHLSSPILFEVLDQRAVVSCAVFTLQKEVADRLIAGPGGRDYGLLSVLTARFFDVERVVELPRRLFHPPPKVDSTAVKLSPLPKPRGEVRDEVRFRALVKAGFGQRRKTLHNALKPLKAEDALRRAGIDPQRRAETLTPEEFAAIERALDPTGA